MIPDAIRPALSRLIGTLAGAGAAALVNHLFGHTLSEEHKAAVGEVGVYVSFAAYGLVYAGVHKTIGARINPTDSAAPSLAKVASGPMGEGQRTQLATTLEQAATAPNEVP